MSLQNNNLLFIHTAAALFIYTRMLFSLEKRYFDLVYTICSGFYSAINVFPRTKNTKN